MKAIELKKVSFSYDGKSKILESVDYEVDYGEVSLLSGHSGEGKSTLMYIISGIIPNVNYGQLTGEVLINGQSIKGKKLGDICRKVGVVLQNADEQIVQKIVEDEVAFACENLAFPPEKIGKRQQKRRDEFHARHKGEHKLHNEQERRHDGAGSELSRA